MSKARFEYPCYTIIGAEGGLFRACRVHPQGGQVEPLPSPYGDACERRQATKLASNALYRELCLGMRAEEQLLNRGLSPDFKIGGR